MVPGRYSVTFAKGKTPPVRGFWSLTLYNEHHFFAPNAIYHYSVGTKNKDLKANPDGSLTFYVQADEPPQDQRETGCRRRPAKVARHLLNESWLERGSGAHAIEP